MPGQVFKYDVSNNLLFTLLDQICTKFDDKYYLVDNIAYKKALYHNILEDFCYSIKKYYFESKKYYVERKLDFNKFMTIIRHICRANNIKYTSKIKYDKSGYEIVYYIYFDNTLMDNTPDE